MKYIVQYALPHEHQVRVGIEAENRDAAIAKASELFDQGDIWQDSAEVPWLYDGFVESGDAGIPLEFTVESEVAGDWQEPDPSIKAIRRREAAFQSGRLMGAPFFRVKPMDGVRPVISVMIYGGAAKNKVITIVLIGPFQQK